MVADSESSYETGQNHEGEFANTPVERLTASSILGDSIKNPEGEKLGTIDNLMVDIKNGMASYAVMELGLFRHWRKIICNPFHGTKDRC